MSLLEANAARMLANVVRLPERREANASHSWGNPEAPVKGDGKEPRSAQDP